MSRLPSDYLPITGSDFFQNVGSMPPSLRVLVETPHEYSYLLSKTKDETVVAERRLLERKIIERYAPAAKAALWTLRQQRRAGIIQVINRHLQLPGGVTMRYTSLSGMEYVLLTVSAVAVTLLMRTVVVEEPTQGNLLVMYSGNRVALIDVASLKSSSVKVQFKKTLASSSWGTDRIKVCQLKFKTGKESLVFGGFKIVNNVVSAATKFNLARTGSPTRSLTQFVESSDATTRVPIFNGDGSIIYTPHDMFVIGNTITLQSSEAAYDEVYITTIGSQGQRYTMGGESHLASNFGIGDWYDLRENFADYNLTATQTTSADSVFAAHPGLVEVYGYVGGGTASGLNFQYGLYPGEGGTATAQLDFKIVTFSQVGGVDRLTVQNVPFTGSFTEAVSGSPGSPVVFAASFRWWDHRSSSTSGYASIIPFPFSMGVEKGKGYLFTTSGAYPNQMDTVEAPYGDEITIDRAAEGNPPSEDLFDGWLHLSNGEHVLQAYRIKSVNYIYYDGDSVADKIASALSISPTDIQAMVMDVPKSRVTALR